MLRYTYIACLVHVCKHAVGMMQICLLHAQFIRLFKTSDITIQQRVWLGVAIVSDCEFMVVDADHTNAYVNCVTLIYKISR
jgi:hypothetical protein